jgi:hypothetical protein
MALVEVEQNLSIIVHCPNCSYSYEVKDSEGTTSDYPKLCRRCASPMDYQEAFEFSEAQAAEQAKGQGFAQISKKK